jgi:hypothetical protein
MRLTWKDGAAAVLVAAIVVPYVGYAVHGQMPLINDPRAMAGVALILGLAASSFGRTDLHWSDGWVRAASVVGAVALGLGIMAGLTGNKLMLGIFVGSIVLLWVVASARHAGAHLVVRWRHPAPPS